MLYTAIDHFRKNNKHRFTTNLGNAVMQVSDGGEDALDRISYEEIIRSVQELPPGCRTVLNLFVIEGFTHEEILDKLGISIGTSKSNLAKARRQLQNILFQQNQIQVAKINMVEERKNMNLDQIIAAMSYASCLDSKKQNWLEKMG